MARTVGLAVIALFLAAAPGSGSLLPLPFPGTTTTTAPSSTTSSSTTSTSSTSSTSTTSSSTSSTTSTTSPPQQTCSFTFFCPTTTTTRRPAGTDALLRWAATNGGGPNAQNVTSDQAVADARNYNWIVALKQTFPPYLSAMRSANPSLKLFAYMNGVYAQANQGPGTGSYPDSYYARDVAGNYISSRSFGNWLMNPTSSGWISDRIQACAQAISSSGYDGCYLDVLGNSSVDPSYVTSVPWNSSTGQAWTAPQWVSATTSLAAQVKSGNPGKLVTGNGISNGFEYFDATSGPTAALIGPLDGANAQGFVRNENAGITTYRGLNRWKQDVDMLVDAGNRGKVVMAMTKIGVVATSAQLVSWQRYALASFLLGTDGHQYFYFDPDGVNAAVAYDHPDLHVRVGAPSGPYAVTGGGAYVRSFGAGFAAVNPTSNSVTVSLGGTYRDLDGVSRTSYTLPPNTGMVFSR